MSLLVFFLFLLSALDSFNLISPSLDPRLISLLGKKIKLTGRVSESYWDQNGKIVLSQLKDSQDLLLPGKVILQFSEQPSWLPGDWIRCETKLKKPHRYQNPGSFDYRKYLARKGILATGFVSQPENCEFLKREGFGLGIIDQIRISMVGKIRNFLSPQEAAFLNTLLVGDRSHLEESVWNDFQKTGTAHLLSISGIHLVVVGTIFYFLFLFLMKRSQKLMLRFSVKNLALLLSLVPVLFYTLFSGASPSAQRAFFGALFVCLALWLRREVDFLSLLAAAGLAIICLNPPAFFSASFQLSFLGILGILAFSPLQDNDLKHAWWKKYVFNPFRSGFGATLMTAPLVAYWFHQVSFSGLITNLWAIPFVNVILISGIFVSWIAIFSPAFAQPLFHVVGFLIRWFLTFLHKSAEWSSQYFGVISFYPTPSEVFFCFLLIVCLVIFYRRPSFRKQMTIILFLICAGWFGFSFFSKNHQDLQVTFLDVGQGDSALIQTPTGKTLLIDGGGFLIPGQKNAFDVGAEVVVPYLKRMGIKKIDRILLSHPHPDHFGGLRAVVDAFPVGEFWSNGQTFPDESFENLQQKIAAHSFPQRILKEGDQWEWEGLGFQVFYPDHIDLSRNINDNSLVVRITFGQASLLFPGDIEKKGERFLSDRPGLQSTILKIPHHGSKTSSSVPFIDTISPQIAVASLGEGNNFGFPSEGVLEKYQRRGVQVFRTDQNGAVTLTVPRAFPKKSISIHTLFSQP